MRNKFIFFFKKASIMLFFLMLVYVALIKIFGESVFPGKYFVLLLSLSLLFFLLLFMPLKLSKENSYGWFLFVSFMLIFWPIAIGFNFQEFHLLVLSGRIRTIFGIVTSLGFIGVFSSFFFGNKPINKEQTRLNVIDSFKDITKKLGLSYKDISTEKIVILEAEGKYKSEYISLAVEFTFAQRFAHGHNIYINKSMVLLKTNKEIPSYKIEVLKEVIRTEQLNEQQKSRVINFIKEKQLDYFDFDLNTFGDKVVINVRNQIEEVDLWINYIQLAEMLSE